MRELWRKTTRGQSLVELAVMMPVLVLILAGILDLGRAYMTLIALRDAAAEGAAYAALHPTDTNQIVARVADSSSGLVKVDPDMVAVECPEAAPGQPITITVRYEYMLLTPVINALVPDGKITMQAQEVRSIIQ